MRFKKILPGMYHDERFVALTPPGPNPRYLWVFLLVGPHTCPIPGLFCAGEAALAEALGWPIAGFRRAFQEIATQGMAKADWVARVVWIPKAIKHNEPENPSVVKSWRKWLDEIPPCDLKREAIEEIGRHLALLGVSWVDAWTTPGPQRGGHVADTLPDTCPPTSATSVAVSSSSSSEQEQKAGAGERVSLPLPPHSPAAGSRNGKPSRRHVDAAWGRETTT